MAGLGSMDGHRGPGQLVRAAGAFLPLALETVRLPPQHGALGFCARPRGWWRQQLLPVGNELAPWFGAWRARCRRKSLRLVRPGLGLLGLRARGRLPSCGLVGTGPGAAEEVLGTAALAQMRAPRDGVGGIGTLVAEGPARSPRRIVARGATARGRPAPSAGRKAGFGEAPVSDAGAPLRGCGAATRRRGRPSRGRRRIPADAPCERGIPPWSRGVRSPPARRMTCRCCRRRRGLRGGGPAGVAGTPAGRPT